MKRVFTDNADIQHFIGKLTINDHRVLQDHEEQTWSTEVALGFVGRLLFANPKYKQLLTTYAMKTVCLRTDFQYMIHDYDLMLYFVEMEHDYIAVTDKTGFTYDYRAEPDAHTVNATAFFDSTTQPVSMKFGSPLQPDVGEISVEPTATDINHAYEGVMLSFDPAMQHGYTTEQYLRQEWLKTKDRLLIEGHVHYKYASEWWYVLCSVYEVFTLKHHVVVNSVMKYKPIKVSELAELDQSNIKA